MKKEKLKNGELESVKGGSKWKVLEGDTPKMCPFCGLKHIANYSGNRWICADCGSVI